MTGQDLELLQERCDPPSGYAQLNAGRSGPAPGPASTAHRRQDGMEHPQHRAHHSADPRGPLRLPAAGPGTVVAVRRPRRERETTTRLLPLGPGPLHQRRSAHEARATTAALQLLGAHPPRPLAHEWTDITDASARPRPMPVGRDDYLAALRRLAAGPRRRRHGRALPHPLRSRPPRTTAALAAMRRQETRSASGSDRVHEASVRPVRPRRARVHRARMRHRGGHHRG
ncbi:hypothetical protein QJS66_02320 [Kocuria rhizophila]|nr:hypothetical protein QJS66_02320 [Kocuria rhizophila]